MRLTRWAVFASLWLLAVGVVGTATWYAIDSAGRSTQVLASSDLPRGGGADPVTSDGTTPAAAPTSATAPTSRSQEPSQGAQPSDGPSNGSSSSSSEPAGSSTTKASSSRSQTSSSSRPSSRTSTSTSASSSSSSAPQAQSKLVKTPGGSVTITCRTDAQIDFTVRPSQGWRGDANQQGPQEAEIKFTSGGELWDVHARCVAGAPDWTVEHKIHED